MRIVIGFLLTLFGLLFTMASLYRIQQVGENLLTYPLAKHSATLPSLYLSPAMNPLQFRVEAFWTQRKTEPSTPLSIQLRLTDPQGASVLVKELRFDVSNNDASNRSPQRMQVERLTETFNLQQEGLYQLDLTYLTGSVGNSRAKVHLSVNSFDPPWHVPLTSGSMVLIGISLMIWGFVSRSRPSGPTIPYDA